MTPVNEALNTIPEIRAQFVGADVIDIKSMRAAMSLRTFAAANLNYLPEWVAFLYRLHGVLARLIHMDAANPSGAGTIKPETVPWKPGENAAFFVVKAAEEDRFWMAAVEDKTMIATLIYAALPAENGERQLYVITVVRFKSMIGRLYFRMIEPFHHLIVRASMRYAARRALPSRQPIHIMG